MDPRSGLDFGTHNTLFVPAGVCTPDRPKTVVQSPQRLNFLLSVKLTVAKLFAFQERKTEFTNIIQIEPILGIRKAVDEMTLEDGTHRSSRNVDK